GGDLANRMRFLRAVCAAVRAQVGPDYPLFIKLGMVDGVEGRLTLDESVQVVASLADMGLDAVEVSGGITGGVIQNSRPAIRAAGDEAYFRAFARAARAVTSLSLMLVGGFRSRQVIDEVLDPSKVCVRRRRVPVRRVRAGAHRCRPHPSVRCRASSASR
ncbi:MAG TPA: hypothetical protein PK384_08155, partial [Candidatus Latescibacteria bacterium]|nr:hypothetical protein [Candidatus Latescibacterota bacterium]